MLSEGVGQGKLWECAGWLLFEGEGGVVGTGEDELRDVDITSGESGFTVGEVVIPFTEEGVIESHLPDSVLLLMEAIAPDLEGFCVVQAKVLEVVEVEVTGGVNGIEESFDGGELTSREDVFFDPIDGAAHGVVARIGADNDL